MTLCPRRRASLEPFDGIGLQESVEVLLVAPPAVEIVELDWPVDVSQTTWCRPGISPRPQPQTGRASFQASGFPDGSVLIVPSQS